MSDLAAFDAIGSYLARSKGLCRLALAAVSAAPQPGPEAGCFAAKRGEVIQSCRKNRVDLMTRRRVTSQGVGCPSCPEGGRQELLPSSGRRG